MEGYGQQAARGYTNQHWICVENLRRAGADINAEAKKRVHTLLQSAIRHGQWDLIDNILPFVDINAPAPEIMGRTALQMACEHGRPDIVEVLLEAGADVNAAPAEDEGLTALQAAAIQGYLGIAEMLLKAGASVCAQGALYGGRTAIEGAAENGRLDMLQFLLDNYDHEDCAEECERAATIAEEEGRWQITNWLRDYASNQLDFDRI